MSGSTKPVRLSKVAKEFNLGVDTIVEFLSNQGVEVESSPNTKLAPEQYGLVREAFADEKAAVAQRKGATVFTDRTSVSVNSKRDTGVEQEVVAVAPPPVVEAPVVEEPIKETPAVEETVVELPAVEEPAVEEPAVEEPAVEAPAVEEPVVELPTVEETVIEAPAAPAPKSTDSPVKKEPEEVEEKVVEVEPKSPLKVMGKVDLDSLAKGKKTAKKKPAEDKKPAEKATPAAPEAKKSANTDAAKKPVVELHRAKAAVLSGPTVVGKIELPVEKKPTSAGEKRKRKRITKVDLKDAAKTAGRGRGNAGARKEVTEKDIQKEIKETLARLSKGKGKKKVTAKDRKAKRDKIEMRAEKEHLEELAAAHTLELTEFVSAAELASMMDCSVNEVISACMALGMMVSINQRLDKETITIIAEEFNFIVDFVSAEVQDAIEVEKDKPEDLVSRPPIVTVMGHVDHGKTSLLDYIRDANVISGEAGGITQHIGAYSVELESGQKMTFIDTPGHEAFTAMRARGAQVTDLAIIVIAADDAVMPQTKEAISHAQAAEIPFIIALNKCDRDTANPDKIKQELSEMNILLEDWGGKIQGQEISAKTGLGVQELLEKVMLEAEMLELKANPNKRAIGHIVESSLDKGRGYVTSILVSSGTLCVGDVFLAGQWSGRIRAMHNEHGKALEEAGPAVPVSILGLNGAPNAGDEFHVMEDEREARSIATKRQQLQREQGIRTQRQLTLEELGRRIAVGEFKELNLIIKADVDGSTEALSDTLLKLSTEKVQVNVIHKGVGQISESDVLLATASEAIIIGFQVRPSVGARKLAERESIQIRLYSIIYQAIEEMKDAMEGLLSAKIEERVLGTAVVQEVYKISKVGTIAGCLVQDGLIQRNKNVRLIRDGIVIYTGGLGSLKRFKDDAKEVKKGIECGLNIEKFNDIKIGDMVESYEEFEVKQTL